MPHIPGEERALSLPEREQKREGMLKAEQKLKVPCNTQEIKEVATLPNLQSESSMCMAKWCFLFSDDHVIDQVNNQ